MWDDVAGKASHDNRDKYVVLQVVLTEKFLGTGSGTKSLTNLHKNTSLLYFYYSRNDS